MKNNMKNNSVNLEATGKKSALPVVISVCAAVAVVGVGGVFLSKHFQSKDNDVKQASVAAEQVKDKINEDKDKIVKDEKAKAEKRELTKNELKDMSDYLSEYGCYGFLASDYADVKNANLYDVFYSGAGVSYEASKEEIKDFSDAAGCPIELDVVAFKKVDAQKLVLDKTGESLDKFKVGLDGFTYLDKYDAYYSEVGDTNYNKIICKSGSVDGDMYTINYTTSNYIEDADLVHGTSTVVLKMVDGKYLFVSNSMGGYEKSSANEDGEMSKEQLSSMSEYLGDVNQCRYGFLLSSYDDVMDVDMKEVLHTGAGLRHDASQEEINAYLNILKCDGLATDLVCMKEDAIDTFLIKYTSHSLSEYKEHGSFNDFTYVSEFKSYDDEHGDTNYQTINCLAGTIADGVYTIDYSLGDSGVKDGTVKLEDAGSGQFKFISNELMSR